MTDGEIVWLYGMCHRADAPEHPLGPRVTLPHKVRLTVEFDVRRLIGTALLYRSQAGDVWAQAWVQLDAAAVRDGADLQRLWPCFALGVIEPIASKSDSAPMGVITSGHVREAALVKANSDPELPAYQIATYERGALDVPAWRCIRCNKTRWATVIYDADLVAVNYSAGSFEPVLENVRARRECAGCCGQVAGKPLVEDS